MGNYDLVPTGAILHASRLTLQRDRDTSGDGVTFRAVPGTPAFAVLVMGAANQRGEGIRNIYILEGMQATGNASQVEQGGTREPIARYRHQRRGGHRAAFRIPLSLHARSLARTPSAHRPRAAGELLERIVVAERTRKSMQSEHVFLYTVEMVITFTINTQYM